ncbi:SRPBCC family protein [Gemmatimonas sp.]|uniref:SRPBCC family protein n=1 Tax=Gemmatimonas sp. TaxID=1962908 RepID=UPI00286D6142|nr:SRPBCC family protein [Gemmatimonas sp.]
MLKTVGIILLVLLGALLLMASRQPDTFSIERSVVIAAPAETIYPNIADLHQWSPWSPYEKLDPQMKKVFNGTPGAAGASYYWSGNSKAGEGTMTVRELMPPSKITMQLDMLKPIEGHNVIEFNLEPADAGTRVTWAMRGANPLLSKVIGLFMNMDTMIGKDFEDGLASLKTQAEAK